MSDLTRTALLVLGAVLLSLAGRWLFLQLFEQRARMIETGYSQQAKANDLLAAEHFLRRGGLRVASIGALDRVLTSPGTNDALLIYTERDTLRREFSERLLEWVAAGGHLIVSAREAPGTDDDQFDGATRDWLLAPWKVHLAHVVDDCDEADPADCQRELPEPELEEGFLTETLEELGVDLTPDEDEVMRVDLPAAASSMEVEYEPTTYLQSAVTPAFFIGATGGEQLMQFSHGQGRITVLTASWIWHNFWIDDYDHARFLWHVVTLGGVPDNVWLAYREDMPPLWQLLWQRAWPVVLVVAAMIGAGLWRAWPRFGPILPSPEQPRRSLREHIQAAGYWRWRNGQAAGLLAGMREALAVRITQVHPDWNHLPRDEFDRRVAALSELHSDQVNTALRGEVSDEAQEFTAIVQLLRAIRKKL